MNYLLDTHVVLWSLLESDNISKIATEIIENPKNNIFVSTLSFWEISMKYSLGKIELTGTNPSKIPEMISKLGFNIIELNAEEASNYHLISGKWHRDPFDRMLIAQALKNDLTLITKDEHIAKYAQEGLKVIW